MHDKNISSLLVVFPIGFVMAVILGYIYTHHEVAIIKFVLKRVFKTKS